MAQNIKFIKGDTATLAGTTIVDGQILYDTTTGQHYEDVGSTRLEVGKIVDTTLSITSTNAIANNAITTSIVNTTAEVNAITADYVPCGTKPVKELITNLNAKFAVITGTTATSITDTVSTSYPTGFTKENSVVISAMAYVDNNWYTASYANETLYQVIQVDFSVSNIEIRAMVNFYNKPYKCCLMRTDI